jgi:hypothetical protein
MQRDYYVEMNYNKYYTKLHGWVDHCNFADLLTYDEAMGLKKLYPNIKILSKSIVNMNTKGWAKCGR